MPEWDSIPEADPAVARVPTTQALSVLAGPAALSSVIGNRAFGRLIAKQRTLAREALAPDLLQSMTQSSISALSDDEIDRRIEAIAQSLPSTGTGTPEQQAQRQNLKLLEDEVDSRGSESPTLTRLAVLGAVNELTGKISAVDQGISALWGSSWYNQGAVDLFKKRFGDPTSKQLAWIKDAATSSRQLAAGAPRGDVDAAFAAFGKAGTNLVATTFGLQLLGVWLAYLQLADIVLRQPTFYYSVERLLVKLDTQAQRVASPFSELGSLDSGRVQAAAVALPSVLDALVKDHSDLVAEVELAAKKGQEDMTVVAIVQLATALASMRIPPGARFSGPPPVSIGMIPGGICGGAMVGARLVVSVEWAEMIRRLVQAGVIALPVAAAGVRAGVMMMAATATPTTVPSGTQVVQGAGAPLQPGKSPLGRYGIDRYGSFANRPKDQLAGHELLENLWLEVKGFGKRLMSAASRENPAVGLTHAEHAEVGRQQRALGLYDRDKLAGMTAEQVIDANADAMQRARIPQDVIETLKKEALRHAATLGAPP